MKINWYNIALHVLRAVINVKRFVFWILDFLWGAILTLNRLYLRTIGFYLYRIIDRIKKKFHKFSFTKQQGALDFFGRRGVLQTILFIVALFIMFPHSRLYTRAYGEIAGRHTILYSLVGPGDQAYELGEIVGNSDFISAPSSDSWRQVAVYSGENTYSDSQRSIDFTSVVAGGNALTKPIIMPGVDIGLIDPDRAPIRDTRIEVIVYEVEPGDVIGSIAEKFGLKPETILSANNLTSRSYIRPGQKLLILPIDGVVHTVARGDTLSKIARTYTANADTISEYNELEESAIKIGEQIIIPGGVKPVPKPIVAVNTPAIIGKPDAIDTITAPPPSVDAPAGVGYIWPTGATIITQYFGLRHTGVDIAGKQGLPIYATKAGTVITSQCGWNGGYGCYIKIDHGGGVVSWYGHASQMFVEVGDTVSQGQTIALVGNTGRSTGPHLHFEIRVNNKYQNPLSYVRK